MKITTRIVFDCDNNILEHEWYEYDGPVALCDRAAQNEAKSAAANAGSVASQEGSNASALGAQLTPFYRQEMNAQHGFNPGQTNELLNYAGSAAGGGMATAQGAANSEAARTRNTSGFSSALDEAARNRNQTMSQANLGVGAQDVMGAKQLNQEGAAGMQGLYGTDTNAMLGSMGQQQGDINAQVNAGKSGWFQNMTGLLGALGKAGGSVAGGMAGGA
jgi:hypothetical protein